MHLKHTLAAVTVAALALAGSAGAQPNVVLVVTDDQRADTLGYMPTVQAELQGKGVTFSNAFAVNPLCCPSRASILTGTYSHTNGVWGNAWPHGGFNAFPDGWTLPVWLDGVGYETMFAGKYLNGYRGGYVPPGWDHWFGVMTHDYYNYTASVDGELVSYGGGEADYSTDVLAGQAVDFIRETEDPFFLYFAPLAPHWPATPAARHEGAHAGVGAWAAPGVNETHVGDKPRYLRSLPRLGEKYLATVRQRQLESLLAVDEAMAAMLATLEETGKLENTLIVFTSDNGQSWGEHRWANKVVPYEEVIRVPLVVRWDAAGLPARAEPRFALNIDLAETVAAAAGVAVDTEGRNLLPLAAGEQPRWRQGFLFEARQPFGWGVLSYCGYRTGRWKYVQHATGEEELYHLAKDRHELRNLAAVSPTIGSYRRTVRRSPCRPPGFAPLPRCTIRGTAGADRLRGTRWSDRVCAGRGRDVIRVRGGGRDVVLCGRGRDRVVADRRDRLVGCEVLSLG